MTTPADQASSPAADDTQVAACALCGHTGSHLVHEGARYAPDATIRSCAGCGLVFYWPRPSASELAEYYATEYRREYDAGVAVEAAYQDAILEARARAARARPLLTTRTRLLEVGASCGAFLEAVRPFVTAVTGVEPGHEHREWGRRHLDLEMVADAGVLRDRRFDVIAMFHTLEHLPDPVRDLRELAGLLAAGGHVVLEVPNVEDALATMYPTPAFLNFYYQRAHLYYFSPATLARTITAAGGKGTVTGLQRYDLSNHLRWLQTGAPGGHGHFSSVLTSEVNSAYAEALIRVGKSDTLWAVATFGGGSSGARSLGVADHGF
ncbi:MAG: class I SAM-dependent methyltransferase [Vicinamibacterales bacterium]